ncbi:MAG: AAA family ATPase, partial [Spirochaetales bacterium]|nr:AAA family ATPase [Spirochaetales bacterium]
MPREKSNPLFTSNPGRASSSSAAGAPGSREPLASRLRPQTLDEFIGQEHIVGPGRLLRRAIQKDQLSSIILSGPPGTGKTTLARIIANSTRSAFIALNAVLSGVGELREAIDKARQHYELYSLKTILFVDEVHRWNKSQQDALLPWVENGTVVLIGATTENPFFEVNRALVSRSRVFLLKPLEESDLLAVARFALGNTERGYGAYRVDFEQGALEHLIRSADGDARSLLNALELAVETSVDSWPPEPGTNIQVDMETAEESIQRRVVLYDKDGDYHYDTISAFIKSLRGSDPDAALYWLARMVYAGEDPAFIFRRMLISAAEDVGLADPSAIQVVYSCAQSFDRIGLPEGQYHLSLAALYLATCPKSNSLMGYFDAKSAVEQESAEVPNHLKDANRDAQGFGHGEGYRYPHAYKDHWTAQQYLPDTLKNRIFYFPGSLGLEGQRKDEILQRREVQLSLQADDREQSDRKLAKGGAVWSREGERRKTWRTRAEGGASARLRAARLFLFDHLKMASSASLLILDPRKGFYALEALRRLGAGSLFAFLENDEALDQFSRLVGDLPELSRPMTASPSLAPTGWPKKAFGHENFDHIVLCEAIGAHDSEFDYWAYAEQAIACRNKGSGSLCVFDILGPASSGLATMLKINKGAEENSAFIADLEAFEEKRGGGPSLDSLAIQGITDSELKLKKALGLIPDSELFWQEEVIEYSREISGQDIEDWLNPEEDYSRALSNALGEKAVDVLRE